MRRCHSTSIRDCRLGRVAGTYSRVRGEGGSVGGSLVLPTVAKLLASAQSPVVEFDQFAGDFWHDTMAEGCGGLQARAQPTRDEEDRILKTDPWGGTNSEPSEATGARLLGAVAICVEICLAQSPVERGYWIRQRGQSARRRACVSAYAIRQLCAWLSDQRRAAPRTTWLQSQPRAAVSGS